jgi:uncharacterized protein YfiM (DUF2279 family)
MIRILLVAFSFGSARGGSAPAGPTVQPDKVKHFAIGTFTQSVGFGTVRVLGGSNGAALAAATVGSATAAVLKERHDRRAGDTISRADMVWTMAGAATVSPLLAQARRSR